MISSTSNSQIKNILQLQKKSKVREEQQAFVIEGIKMFEESRDGGQLIKAYVSESFYQDIINRKPEYFLETPYEIVTDSVFKEMADTLTPQGIMAIVKKPEYSLKDIISHPKANLVLLEDIRDPGNLGTIVRTAEGAGVTGIVLSKTSVDMYNPKVIRSTMGAIYRMPFVYAEDFLSTLKEIKNNQVSIYGAYLTAAVSYDEIDYSGNCAILVGNEANGLSKEAASLTDKNIIIPMEGKVESLNAAVAAAILMYEVNRQRRKIRKGK